MTRISIPALRRALDRRQLREADIDHGLYVAPRGARGEHIVEYPIGSGNQIHVGSALQGQTFAPGTAVPLGSHTGDSRRLIIGGPPSGRRGISQFPVDAPPPGQLESVGIIAATPATIESGASAEPATLTGYGFRASDTFEAVRQTSSGWEVDPLVTVATVSIDDSETAQVTLTVSSSAPAGYAISFRPVDRAAVGPNLVLVTVVEESGIQMLAFWRGGSSDPLEAWSVSADGSAGDLFAQVVVDDQTNDAVTFTDRGRRMARMQSIIHADPSGQLATPCLVWFAESEQVSSPTGIKGYAWSPVTGAISSWLTTPRFTTGPHVVSTPFMPSGETGGYVYYLQFDRMWDVLNDPGGVTLYKVIPSVGSPVKVAEVKDAALGDYVDYHPNEGSPESSSWVTVDDGAVWLGKSGGTAAGTISGEADDRGARGWRPHVGNDGTGPVSIWFDRTGTYVGRKRRHRFDEAAKDRESLVGWASAAASSYTGLDSVVTVNADRDTDGMFPHDGPQAGGGYLKLSQPLGDETAEGNDGEDPRIFVVSRGGHVPHFVHLVNYAHPWS